MDLTDSVAADASRTSRRFDQPSHEVPGLGQAPPRALVRAKLTPPRVSGPSALINRPRLIEKFQWSREHRLIVVCAPAGYGKSTLVVQSANSSTRIVAWLSLDDQDNDEFRFTTYLAGAFHEAGVAAFPDGASERAVDITTTPTDIIEGLLNALAATNERLVLIIDDYHRIQNPAIHKLLEYFLEFMPPTLKLVITSRVDPPLPLARWRMLGEMIDIGTEDLQFSAEETSQYFAMGLEGRLPPGLITTVQVRTEGWVVALQLLKLLMAREHAERRATILEDFLGSHRQVTDYLLAEVIRQQPPERRDFLLKTSILTRLTGALCDAVTGERNGQAMLEGLERDAILIFALDRHRRWYRYHHLLSEMLSQQLTDELGEGAVRDLHQRACDWLLANGAIDDALAHAVAAENWDQAIAVIHDEHFELSVNRRTLATHRWLDALPEEIRANDPVVAVWFGRSLASMTHLTRAIHYLQRAERLSQTPDQRHQLGHIHMALSYCATQEGRVDDALAFATSAIDLNAPISPWARAGASYTHGVALSRSGRPREAVAAFKHASEEASAPTMVYIEWGRALALLGNLADAQAMVERGLITENLVESSRRGQIWLADIHFAQHEIDRAETCLDLAEDIEVLLDGDVSLPLLEVARARVLWASGESKAAFRWLDRGIERAKRAGITSAVREAESIRASYWLAMDRLSDVATWAAQVPRSHASPPPYPQLEEHLTYCQYLIARNESEAAIKRLQVCRQAADDDGRIIDVGRARLIETLALHRLGRERAANDLLRETVELLEPTRNVQCFASIGDPLIGPLRAVAAGGHTLEFISRVLEAIGYRPSTPPPQEGLIEPLSRRELEVLRLVSVGLSNREISDQLFISVPTVKRHLSTIFEKLAASSRTQAVNLARGYQLI